MKLLVTMVLSLQIFCIDAQSASVTIENLAPEDYFDWMDDYYRSEPRRAKDASSLVALEQEGDLKSIDQAHRKIIKSCSTDSIDAFKLVIGRYGASIHGIYLHKASLLHYACKRKIDLHVLKYLLAERVGKETPDNEGATPLHWAAKYNNIEALKYLLDLGADIEAQDHRGNTPLHWAYRYRSDNAGFELIRRGASDQVVNNAGNIPSQAMVETKAACCVIL